MLTKTVLCADTVGACRLVEVPFEWSHGDPLPADALEQWFPTAQAALSEMAARGRSTNRVHVAAPPAKQAPRPSGSNATNAGPQSAQP